MFSIRHRLIEKQPRTHKYVDCTKFNSFSSVNKKDHEHLAFRALVNFLHMKFLHSNLKQLSKEAFYKKIMKIHKLFLSRLWHSLISLRRNGRGRWCCPHLCWSFRVYPAAFSMLVFDSIPNRCLNSKEAWSRNSQSLLCRDRCYIITQY